MASKTAAILGAGTFNPDGSVKLEGKQLVHKTLHPYLSRQHLVRLTAKGEKLYKEINAIMNNTVNRKGCACKPVKHASADQHPAGGGY